MDNHVGHPELLGPIAFAFLLPAGLVLVTAYSSVADLVGRVPTPSDFCSCRRVLR